MTGIFVWSKCDIFTGLARNPKVVVVVSRKSLSEFMAVHVATLKLTVLELCSVILHGGASATLNHQKVLLFFPRADCHQTRRILYVRLGTLRC